MPTYFKEQIFTLQIITKGNKTALNHRRSKKKKKKGPIVRENDTNQTAKEKDFITITRHIHITHTK